MCETCGCGLSSAENDQQNGHSHALTVMEGLLHANDHAAAHNRTHLDEHGVLAINLMSSPGSGKTSLLEATIEELGNDYRIAVVEGDLETENDARRIRSKGVPAIQISTGSACHLDAHVIHGALHELGLNDIDLLFIENVGNLVCPAAFDLGQHCNVVLLSVPEGDDKPAKYPVMFRKADLLLLSKSDLLPALPEFRPHVAIQQFRCLANAAPVISLSVRARDSLRPWIEWLKEQLVLQQQRRRQTGRAVARQESHGTR